jgi:hypothetical protein
VGIPGFWASFVCFLLDIILGAAIAFSLPAALAAQPQGFKFKFKLT